MADNDGVLRFTLDADAIFTFDGDEVDERSGPALDQIVRELVPRDAGRIAVEVHTDEAEDPTRSQARAEAVAVALGERGLEPAAIEARGFGADWPRCAVDDDLVSRRNRRVEIVWLP